MKSTYFLQTQLPGGGFFEIEIAVDLLYRPAEGDGWNSPRYADTWEMDGYRPLAIHWVHPDESWESQPAPAGSILYHWLAAYLKRNWSQNAQEAAALMSAG